MKKDKIFVLCIDILATILSILSIVFIVIDAINIIPLFNAFSYNSVELEYIINKTQIGKIILGISATEESNLLKMAGAAILSFIKNAHFMVIIIILFIIFLLFIKFYQNNWEYVIDINQYLKIYKWISVVYVLKYILSAAFFGLLYNGTTQSYFNSFFSMPFVHIVTNILLIGLFILPIIRLVFKFKTLGNR